MANSIKNEVVINTAIPRAVEKQAACQLAKGYTEDRCNRS
jgi:hypothetical protein